MRHRGETGEGSMSVLSAYEGRRVLITGRTGFKGAWLSRLLEHLGAEVHGISLPAEPGSLGERLGVRGSEPHEILDIRDTVGVTRVMHQVKPEIVFHLAAQALVLRSFSHPVETFSTNVMGTVSLLNAVGSIDQCSGVVVATTDKVYAPQPDGRSLTEGDRLGGVDPYSASKASVELVVESWRNVYAQRSRGLARVTARAGTVIGGGDSSAHRILPDLLRSFRSGTPLAVRNPNSIRPWQHVLDGLWGYLRLGEEILAGAPLAPAYNFGPSDTEGISVADVCDYACEKWGFAPGWKHVPDETGVVETAVLRLSSDKSSRELAWRPTLTSFESIDWTLRWEMDADVQGPAYATQSQVEAFCLGQIQ